MHGRPAAQTAGPVGTSHPHRWRILGVLVVSLLVTSIDHTIMNVALPALALDLGPTASQLQWVVDVYTLVFAGALLLAGSLGDRFGRLSALTAGLVMFAVGSAVAATATSVSSVIGGRAVMGLGAALIMPATLSILVNVFGDPRERAKAIGIWAAVSGAGIALGPIVGGLLMRQFSWASVFWINVPLLLVALVGARHLVPQSRDEGAGRLDPLGALLSAGAITLVTYGVIEAPNHGWASPFTHGVLAAGLATAAAFVAWELRRHDPMLDVRLFRSPSFTAASSSLALLFFAMSGAMFLQAQYLQFVLEYSPLRAGLALAPAAVGILLGTGAGTHLGAHLGGRLTVAAGTLTAAAGLAVQALLADGSSYPPTGAGLVLFGVGAGLAMPAATASVMAALPAAKAGVGSAVNDTTREVGAALGVAVVGSVAATAYTARMQTQVGIPPLPEGLRAAANDNIGAAVVVSGDLRSGGAHLAQIAQDAFVTSMAGAIWVAVGVSVWATVIAVVHMPRRSPAPSRTLT